ncbi:aspartate ammonia-lyase [Pseudaminobacter arsenicus]|uniref:Aspartate ammonia-lyase n=1 Tax=Borborobacter arsenicus TaxID=1851146 RepID=A0A432V7J2_9HYPH|nr:aspartate ammonia-lyase [Pseudaminobacter arsenicus]RUM98132.1 aspartate ammonia-lyase [Pseudaminobacter arsenicus]
MQFRREHDSLGSVDVPVGALWGAQTERARGNFRITGITLSRFPHLITALAMTKKAAARANLQLGVLSSEKFEAICAACDEIIAGRHREAFPLDAIQGGAGTSVNMNANEVIANLANERLGGIRGANAPVHPNDDVNRSQSTNDVYPTAVRLSLILAHADLGAAIVALADSFDERAKAFAETVKLGRTQLQDAVPMTLGQEFAAFAAVLREDVTRLQEMLPLLGEVNLGGTAIGTGLNAPRGYAEVAIAELSAISGHKLTRAANLIEASWDMGAFVLFSGMLKRLATKLSKISNDLRLLSSGPRGGLGEIRLPAAQPGSSIMPGKVNPVIPEVVNQVCFQVIGNDLAITFAAEAGQLQLNAMEPLIAFNLHFSIQMLHAAIRVLDEGCVQGVEADAARSREHLEASVGTVTALVPLIGYGPSAELAKDALRLDRKIADLAVERGLVTSEQAAEMLDPMLLAFPT